MFSFNSLGGSSVQIVLCGFGVFFSSSDQTCFRAFLQLPTHHFLVLHWVLEGKGDKGFKHPSEGLPKLVPSCRCFLVVAEVTLHWKSTSTAGQRMTSTSEAELEHFHPANICRNKRETLNLQ